jgi:hypothetical protein
MRSFCKRWCEEILLEWPISKLWFFLFDLGKTDVSLCYTEENLFGWLLNVRKIEKRAQDIESLIPAGSEILSVIPYGYSLDK